MGRHDGYYTNGVTLGVSGAVAGSTNSAANFDGSSGYAEVPFSKALNTQSFTIECWAKADPVAATLCPLACFTQPPGRGYLFQKSSDGQWYYMFGDGTDTAVLYLNGSDALYNQWVHLALTYDGSTFTGYLNGVLDVQAQPPLVPNNISPLRIGFDQTGNGWNDFWSGDIDEVAYYQSALTSDQIAQHYSAGLYGAKSKPVFVKQPESATAAVGTQFFFDASVAGTVPLQFQWS
jgi:hypothetical protein